MRRTAAALGLLVLCAVLAGCAPDRAAFIPPEGKYDARILRDTWGVPHVFGKTDADAAYGLAYAQCEDDWVNVEDGILLGRGLLASVHGRDWAKFDYLVHWFRVPEFVEEKYEAELDPDARALVEGYADGITHFAALHPGKMPHIRLPVTGKDVVIGTTFKGPFFYDLQTHLAKIFGDEGGATISKKGIIGWRPTQNPFTRGQAIGSNAFAVGPSRSADGATRLAINSHMPYSGPVTWYEAHVHSEEGWNVTGGTFPGGPVLFVGHDEDKGWCHTINRPDLADTYVLEVNPANENQYKFDGQWRDFERGTARIKIKLWGPISWTFKRELLWSVHGPAVRRPDGVYAIRFAGYGEVRQIEQWYRMNKARNLEAFIEAMRRVNISSTNTVYADKEGNLLYVYNGQFPVRADGYDWQGQLPGDTSDTLWTEYHPFADLPQVLNPASGFIQSCNNSPYRTTVGDANPKPEGFSPTMGIETSMTNRSLRALELYGGDPSITREEFYAYKYDKTYSQDSRMQRFLEALFNADVPEEPLLQEGLALLKGWDRTTTRDNRAAALAILAMEHAWDLRGVEAKSEPVERLRRATHLLMEKHGRLDVPWEEMMRLRRGDLDLGLGGAPDCLRAVDVALQKDGVFTGINGDCYFTMVEWDKDGKVRSESIHQYGAATLDENSPHYADQAPLFAREEMRPSLLTEEAVRAHLKREYRPGEITGPWYAE